MACENAAPRDYRACRTGGQARRGYPRRVAGVGDAVGPYRIEALLGEGGMGQVFRAAHAQTGDLVALKLLRPEFASDEGLIRRLLREARAARTVEHRHLVGLLDAGEAEGEHYLALELVPACRSTSASRPRVRSRSTTSCGSPPTWRPGSTRCTARDRAPRRQALERPARRRGRGAAHRLRAGQGPDYSALTLPGQMLGTMDYLRRAPPRRRAERRLGRLRLRLPGLRMRRGPPAVRGPGPVRHRRRAPRRGAARPVRRALRRAAGLRARPSASRCARRRPTARRRPRPMLDQLQWARAGVPVSVAPCPS